MPIAFYLLTALLVSTPLFALVDSPLARYGSLFATGLILAAAAIAREPEIVPAVRLLKKFSLALIVPLAWIVVQCMPISAGANSIWSTTAIALNDPSLPGHISLDPRATLSSVMWYLAMVSLIISTTIVTRDRRRAELTLFVLAVVTTVTSVGGMLSSFTGSMLSSDTSRFAAAAAVAAIANSAIIARAIERHIYQRKANRLNSAPFLGQLIPGLCGFTIAIAGLVTMAPDYLIWATALGWLLLLFIAAVRRLGLPPWSSTILLLIVFAIASTLALPSLKFNSDRPLEFFFNGDSKERLIARRALSDVPWTGTGVQTFRLLSQAYREFGASASDAPPTTAIKVAIEWGKPALLILYAITVQFFLFVFRGAVRRGRDPFFASAAAAIILMTLLESLIDSSLLSLSAQMIVAVMLGLGISQSIGRTNALA